MIEIRLLAAKAEAEGLADSEEFKRQMTFLRERALENKVFIVAANRLDAKIHGQSRIVLPNAAIPHRSESGQFDYTFGYLNLVWTRDKQIRPGTDLIKNRRPHLYGGITGVEPENTQQQKRYAAS